MLLSSSSASSQNLESDMPSIKYFLDPYDCITLDTRRFSFPCMSPDDISKLLDRCIDDWQSNRLSGGKKAKAVWFKVGIRDTKWIPILIQKGFTFHHAIGKRSQNKSTHPVADEEYVMLTKILNGTTDDNHDTVENNVSASNLTTHLSNGSEKTNDTSNGHVDISNEKRQNVNLPSYAFTTVGVSGIVMHPDDMTLNSLANPRVLVIREKRNGHFWKFPGGLSEPGEEISDTACREVKEETGISTQFGGILSFRHTHTYLFGCSDLYFVCILRAQNCDIVKDIREVQDAQWIKVKDLLESKDYPISDSVRFLIENFMKTLDSNLETTKLIPIATKNNCNHKEADAIKDAKTNSLHDGLMLPHKILSFDKRNVQTWYSPN